MSYQPPPPRPSSTGHHPQGQNAGQNLSQASTSTQASNSSQTPVDWSSFMSFQQSPGTVSNGQQQRSRDNKMENSHPRQDRPDENYQSFAQGIAMNRPSPSSINFAPPQYRSTSQPQPPRHPSPLQHRYPQGEDSSRTSSSGSNKGKSPVNNTQQSVNDPSNGLSLDPSAFSRDIRFQVPPFLSNTFSGAPTFPPGGEAWSGFSPGNLFENAGGHQLTPGALFGTNTYGSEGYNDGSGTGRNVLEGLSGFMNDGSWENWGEEKQSPDNNQNFGTTFYVNPNPSPSVLAPKHEVSQDRSQRPTVPPITVNGAAIQTSAKSVRSNMSPMSSTTGTMPTSAMFAQQDAGQPPLGSFDMPSMSTDPSGGSLPKATNIASSSTQPYAPPQNAGALLQGPSLPSNLTGTSLADGPGLYSTTGFDMVGILSRVANRKDPKTQLGPVDFSCSFIVVDIHRYDSPIVYASPTFSALTGYELPQIVGRNCRFLQSPDGEVVKGSKRKYTDNVAVAHFKRMLNAGKECQASLINYRRGGTAFINLVTVIPITWDSSEVVYHVGFQVDLVEQPNAILRNMRDGSYQVNYTVTSIPSMPLRPPTSRDLGAVGLSAEILEVLGPKVNAPGFAVGEDGGKMEWLKMVLENADDFVHVLSLKGMFQYVSPSVRRVLEYEPEDLVNKNMSDVCHPSDIVPIMRELKDSTHAPADGNSVRTVNLVFRVRRKSSGYVWIECTGRLHVEAGKGRKAVILTGRARSVPTLPWETVSRHGGLGDREFWTKVTFDGLILHSTSSVHEVLGKTVDEILGHSIFALLPRGVEPTSSMDPNSHAGALAAALQQAAHGDAISGAVSLNHKMVHSSGGVVDVQMIFYHTKQPADTPNRDSESSMSELSRPTSSSFSTGGIKPSSLVVQIKLLPTRTPRPIVHPPSANVFEELETTRGTSWQYELHQLRLLNRRLKDDIASLRARGRSGSKGKKRKAGDPIPSTRLTSMPSQYSAAPKHQLTPGFGLVAPGMPSPYYR